MKFFHDHATLEEFVQALARAHVYNTWDISNVIDGYWREEAIEWVKEFEGVEEKC